MNSAKSNPMLRLVNADTWPRATSLSQVHNGTPRSAVMVENHAAAGLCATDARWVLAVRATQSLEGGRAGVLSPEKRRRLIAFATGMGLRPFDANLIIAIVQDAARTGAGPLSLEVESRLRILPEANTVRKPASPWMLIALSSVAGALIASVIIGWILSGQ